MLTKKCVFNLRGRPRPKIWRKKTKRRIFCIELRIFLFYLLYNRAGVLPLMSQNRIKKSDVLVALQLGLLAMMLTRVL